MDPHAERDIALSDPISLTEVDFDLDCDTQIDVFVVPRDVDPSRSFDADTWPGDLGPAG